MIIPSDAVPVSKHCYLIAGILTTIYGIDDLPSNSAYIACIWLHHGRLGSQDSVQPLASHIVRSWNAHLQSQLTRNGARGLVAVTFDQRNHGSRQIDEVANKDWMEGNKRHAQDMFSIYRIHSLEKSASI